MMHILATAPLVRADDNQLIKDATNAFASGDVHLLEEVCNSINNTIMKIKDGTTELRNDKIPDLTSQKQDLLDSNCRMDALNSEMQALISGKGEATEKAIQKLRDEVALREDRLENLTIQGNHNSLVESHIQTDIDNLLALKSAKSIELSELTKKLELTRFDAYNLSSLLALRRHMLLGDFSEAVIKQKAEIAELEDEYNGELCRIGTIADEREQDLIEERIRQYEKKIEGHAKFEEDVEQLGFEEVERRLRERIRDAKEELQRIQHDVEKTTRGPVLLESPAAALKSLRSILDDAKSTWRQSKNAIQRYDHQIRQREIHNAELSKKIAEQQLVLDLQRRQQEDYQKVYAEALEKLMRKIHEFNLGLIDSNAAARAVEEGIDATRKSIRGQEELYMSLSIAGSVVYYICSLLLL